MSAPPVPRYVVGCDLGQSNDYTSILVVRPGDQAPPVYDLGHIERVPLGTRYPAIVAHLGGIVGALRRPMSSVPDRLPARPAVTLVVDYTGVGRPVADMLVDAALDCDLVLVTITGADAVTIGPGGEWRVPKRDLASAVQRILQESRLVVPDNHPMAQTLTTELTGFRAKINPRGHDSYGAGEDWRSAPHDDLVLGLALALWKAEYGVEVALW